MLDLHVRSVEVMDQRGLLDRFLAGSSRFKVGGLFADIVKLWPGRLDTAHPFGLAIPQAVTERLLTEHAVELGIQIRRGCELVGFSQDEHGVTVALADGTQLRSRYLVGCDGGHCVVCKLLGVGFPGEPTKVEMLLGDVEVTKQPARLSAVTAETRKAHVRFGAISLGEGMYRIIVPTEEVAQDCAIAPTLEEFKPPLGSAFTHSKRNDSKNSRCLIGAASQVELPTARRRNVNNGRKAVAGHTKHLLQGALWAGVL